MEGGSCLLLFSHIWICIDRWQNETNRAIKTTSKIQNSKLVTIVLCPETVCTRVGFFLDLMQVPSQITNSSQQHWMRDVTSSITVAKVIESGCSVYCSEK
ncbi:hypothetical protein O6H91_18G069600 [Diphasiastrum complanatum]|uniref:Uncharacterized protein n=1 Tax=Diphasiastrum complanatum TaxID=34168 RepID=A0ACC2B2E7_DIPCM|nr:hypothetical protein O6H91_18G069600 [Diphasiastrum complanatum]